MNRKAVLTIAAVLSVLSGLLLYRPRTDRGAAPAGAEARDTVTAGYVFDEDRRIHAVFHTGDAPRADLRLSDGREFVLPRARSASGARYADAGGRIVFWTKGDTAFLEENGKVTYADGKQVSGD